MGSLLIVLKNVITTKFLPILTRIRFWLSWSNIKNRVLAKVRLWLTGIFDIKPRNKDDYYTVFGWLVSRRLIHAIIITIGVVSLVYIVFINPIYDFSKVFGGTGTYSYASLPLRFADGKVKIKAKSGYIAYEGEVKKGYVTGKGTLYDENQQVVYDGEFDKNMYNGQGQLYYPTGQVKYSGMFQDNLYEGEGTSYRENGARLYQGNFAQGFREGNGILFDSADKAVFTGTFHRDDIVYSLLLNKDAKELPEIYAGKSVLYINEEQRAVLLEDIDALYLASSQEDSLSDTVKADRIYVCKDFFTYGTDSIKDIDMLKEKLGQPVFEGNSFISFPETVAAVWLQKYGEALNVGASMEMQQDYDELVTVTSYAQDTTVYLYVFQINDLTYTFVAKDRNSGFFMYEIE